jgi:hypothetical protein
MTPGIYPGIPMRQYLEIDALGSSLIERLAISPLHYQHARAHPEPGTPALARGIALHMAVLEPQLFIEKYAPEPDVAAIGGAKPRATNAYREQVAELEAAGQIVLKDSEMALVLSMAAAIQKHPHAAKVLRNCPDREVSAIWSRGERLCRGRFDLLGANVMADLKTTRSLASFNPWGITKLGYFRQAGHYVDGARRLGRDVDGYFIIAVESAAPYDVGVFLLEKEILSVGLMEVEALMRRLDACELANDWPGMFPDVQEALLSDAAAIALAGAEEE